MNGRNEDGEGPADDEFEETKEGGTVDIDQEIDNGFHGGQGKDESGPSTIQSPVDGICKLLVRCEGHVPREAGSGGSGSFCGLAARKKVLLGTRDRTLGRISRRLEAEDDEEERKNGICDPSQGKKMGQLEIWLERGRHR